MEPKIQSWRRGVFVGLFLIGAGAWGQAVEVDRLSFPLPPEMTRAEVMRVETVAKPQAVVVLCPGANGNGEGMVRQQVWQDFAREHRLGLMGIHFQSSSPDLINRRGYYLAENGSGQIVLEAIQRWYGQDLPVLLHGFSGGAHFTTRFIEWRPERVKGWFAAGISVRYPPEASESMPPGLMACGDRDSGLGGALMFFKQGRALGKPWLWAEVPGLGHGMSNKLEIFVRDYFAAILETRGGAGMWVDIDDRREITPQRAAETPSVSAWLPDQKLYANWRKLNEG